MITRLLHTRYRVNDLEKTVAFYKDVLGLQEISRHTSGRGSTLVFFKAPKSDEAIEICHYPKSGPVSVQADLTHLAFEVEDLDAFAREAAATISLTTAIDPGGWARSMVRISRSNQWMVCSTVATSWSRCAKSSASRVMVKPLS